MADCFDIAHLASFLLGECHAPPFMTHGYIHKLLIKKDYENDKILNNSANLWRIALILHT